MASNNSPLADRADVHRACKSLETLLSVLNDYCEATDAVATLQKKLAKALRETAGLKVTGEIPAHAMSASANIFEVLAEIDAKFSKILDKEYDAISGEVRKWFKKLAKEERTHDERINGANARIKHAGQLYEKKAKKSARDAVEEHTKYINLLTTLGPEISQEKYNHALQVTQRHTATTYSVASCLSRMADAEWARSCEEIRRFSPTVGQLGEWRALCEGGWKGPIPHDLPNLNDTTQRQDQADTGMNWDQDARPTAVVLKNVNSRDSRDAAQNNTEGLSPIGHTKEHHPSSISPASSQQQVVRQIPVPVSPGPSEQNTTTRLDPPSTSFESEMNSDSIRSLSAFPSPPTHFPLPPVSIPSGSQRSLSQAPSLQTWTSSSASPVAPSVLSRLVESPKQADRDLQADDLPRTTNNKPPSDDRRLVTTSGEKIELAIPRQTLGSLPETERRTPQRTKTEPSYQLNMQKTPSASDTPEIWRKGDSLRLLDNHEIKVHAGEPKPNSADAANSKGVERRDTSVSLVAAMRNRYSYAAGTTSPVAKDVPRLPLSVTDLASRYQPVDDHSPPQRRAASPTSARPVPFPNVDSFSQGQMAESSFHERSRPVGYEPGSSTDDADIVRRRRRRLEELAELELKEKEFELKAREHEIELRARELERDRARLMTTTHGDVVSGDDPLTQRSVPGRYSYSTTHLVPPPDPQSPNYRGKPSRSQDSSPKRLQSQTGEHAPYCGCDQCSVAKYKTRNTPSPHDLRPPEKPINLRPEKTKGNWMRRLSMPVLVGNAFSLDSKKNTSVTSLKHAVLEDGRLVRRSHESSMANLGRR